MCFCRENMLHIPGFYDKISPFLFEYFNFIWLDEVCRKKDVFLKRTLPKE